MYVQQFLQIVIIFFVTICLVAYFMLTPPKAKPKQRAIKEVFEEAISSAAAMLANDRTQDLAIAAATSCLAIWIKEPIALAVCTQIITQAVPTISKTLCKIQPDCGEDRCARALVRRIIYKESEEFQILVDMCVEEYNNQMSRKKSRCLRWFSTNKD